MKRNNKSNELVAEIALYGTSEIGAGYIASTIDGNRMGSGEPRAGRTMTEAVWLAAAEIRESGLVRGMVRVFAPAGRFMADTDLQRPGYYGNLKWQRATVLELNTPVEEAVRTKILQEIRAAI